MYMCMHICVACMFFIIIFGQKVKVNFIRNKPKLTVSPPARFHHLVPSGRGVRALAGKHRRGRPGQAAAPQVPLQRGLVRQADQLCPLPGRHVHGRLRAGPGRQAPEQPAPRQKLWQDPPHRLWRLLRGGHDEGKVSREDPLQADEDAHQRHGGDRHRGDLQVRRRRLCERGGRKQTARGGRNYQKFPAVFCNFLPNFWYFVFWYKLLRYFVFGFFLLILLIFNNLISSKTV